MHCFLEQIQLQAQTETACTASKKSIAGGKKHIYTLLQKLKTKAQLLSKGMFKGFHYSVEQIPEKSDYEPYQRDLGDTLFSSFKLKKGGKKKEKARIKQSLKLKHGLTQRRIKA